MTTQKTKPTFQDLVQELTDIYTRCSKYHPIAGLRTRWTYSLDDKLHTFDTDVNVGDIHAAYALAMQERGESIGEANPAIIQRLIDSYCSAKDIKATTYAIQSIQLLFYDESSKAGFVSERDSKPAICYLWRNHGKHYVIDKGIYLGAMYEQQLKYIDIGYKERWVFSIDGVERDIVFVPRLHSCDAIRALELQQQDKPIPEFYNTSRIQQALQDILQRDRIVVKVFWRIERVEYQKLPEIRKIYARQ